MRTSCKCTRTYVVDPRDLPNAWYVSLRPGHILHLDYGDDRFVRMQVDNPCSWAEYTPENCPILTATIYELVGNWKRSIPVDPEIPPEIEQAVLRSIERAGLITSRAAFDPKLKVVLHQIDPTLFHEYRLFSAQHNPDAHLDKAYVLQRDLPDRRYNPRYMSPPAWLMRA